MAKQEDSTPMTAEQAQRYFNDGGTWCPYCGSANIEGESVNVETSAAYQPCQCGSCHRSWSNSYHLAAVIDGATGNVLWAEPVDLAAKLARLARLSDSLMDFSKTLDEASTLFVGTRLAATSKPRIIVEVAGGVVQAIAANVPIDTLNVSVLDFDNLTDLDGMPDEVLSDAERQDLEHLRHLLDEDEALPYNETP